MSIVIPKKKNVQYETVADVYRGDTPRWRDVDWSLNTKQYISVEFRAAFPFIRLAKIEQWVDKQPSDTVN